MPIHSPIILLHGDRELDFTSARDVFEVAIRRDLDEGMRGVLLRTRRRSVFYWAYCSSAFGFGPLSEGCHPRLTKSAVSPLKARFSFVGGLRFA